MSSSDLRHFMINEFTESQICQLLFTIQHIFQSEISKKIVDAQEVEVVKCEDIDDMSSFSVVSLIKPDIKNAIWGG